MTFLGALKAFRGTLILLTRSIQTAHELVNARDVLELEALELEASAELLRKNLGPHTLPVSEVNVHDTARLMACLPRALIQTSSLLNDTGMTLPQFLDMYQQTETAKLRFLGGSNSILQLTAICQSSAAV